MTSEKVAIPMEGRLIPFASVWYVQNDLADYNAMTYVRIRTPPLPQKCKNLTKATYSGSRKYIWTFFL
jgi:hypothetical protein